jgi:hypothetical protein
MKKVLVFVMAVIVFAACESNKTTQQSEESQWTVFGEAFDASEIVEASQLMAQLEGQDSLEVTVSGLVEKTCKMKGCWMTVQTEEGKTMRVTFKDYGFFVPKNAENVDAIFTGVARIKTTSVEDLKHFAEDAGKSAEEIEAITEPKTELVFVATGVKMKAPAAIESSEDKEEQKQENHDHAAHGE